MLQLPAQLELELAQRLNHVCLEQRRRRRITFHLSIRESLQLIDHFIKFSRTVAGRAPITSQVLSFTQPLAYLRRKLSRVAPTLSSTHHSARIWSAALPVALRLTTTTLRAAGLLATLLLTALLPALLPALRSLLALLSFLTLLSLLPLLTLLPLLLALLLAIIALAPVGPFIQPAPQRIEVVGKLTRAIEILFRGRTVRAARTLLSRLQAFGKIVQTALDRAFLATATTALLTLLSLLTVIQTLLTFANPIRNTIARE